MKYSCFDGVKARLFVADSKEPVIGEVIPIYMNKDDIRFLALYRHLRVEPGEVDLRVEFSGWRKTSNEVPISRLAQRIK